MLSDEDIILLDNEIQDSEDYITDEIDEELQVEQELEDELIETVDRIVEEANIDIDSKQTYQSLSESFL